jgi:ABC-type branched-subunit amino acid transport system substrate-binding protein
MTHRISAALLVAVAFAASACAGSGPTGDGDASGPIEDPLSRLGVERNLSDGARRVDTAIDPAELDPPLPPRPKLGDLTIPCGPAVEPLLDGDSPGLTAESITIGPGNDRGGLYTAGSGRGIPDTIRALADGCNALGGINGRVIEVVERDAAVLEIDQQVRAACDADFALVGHGYLLDATTDPIRAECGLPAFPAWTTMRPAADAPTVVAVPSQPDELVLDGLVISAFAAGQAGARVAMVVPATAGGRDAAARLEAALARAGLDIGMTVYEYALDRPADWESIASTASSDGAGVVWVEGSCVSTLVPLMEAAQTVGWEPTVTGNPSLYDPMCASRYPTLVEGALIALPVHPPEDSRSVDAVDAHVRLLQAAGVEPTADALLAASAFWLWATSAAECAEPLTRGCVVAHAAGVDSWTAGGLHAATGPGDFGPSGCIVLVAAVDGVFERVTASPDGAMDCGPDENAGAIRTAAE